MYSMQGLSKLLLPVLAVVVVGIIYFFYFAPTDELGSFGRFNPNSEINSEIVVKIVHDKGFEPIGNGRTLFFAEDKHGTQMRISAPNDIIPDGIRNANKLELLGHLHGQTFTTARISIIE
jgi:hypothetical protein